MDRCTSTFVPALNSVSSTEVTEFFSFLLLRPGGFFPYVLRMRW